MKFASCFDVILRVGAEVQNWLNESPFTEMKDIQIIADAEKKVMRSNERKSYDYYK
jgi:hypothetical protein